MATPERNAFMMEKEIERFYGVLKHTLDELSMRNQEASYWGPSNALFQRYIMLKWFADNFCEQLEKQWAKLDDWRVTDTRIETAFFTRDLKAFRKIKLIRMMATNVSLTDAEADVGLGADELWPNTDTVWEMIYDIIDSLAHHAICYSKRCNWWVQEWASMGTTRQETNAQVIMQEAADAAGALRGFLGDMAIDVAGDKAATTRGLDIRELYMKPQVLVAGGLYELNYGQEPLGTVPDLYDPDIDTTRDRPELA